VSVDARADAALIKLCVVSGIGAATVIEPL